MHTLKDKQRNRNVVIAVLVCLMIAVALLAMIATIMGERYTWQLDLTRTHFFMLSEESIRYLDRLDKEVVLYVLTSEENFTSSGGLYFIQAQQVLRQYDAYSPYISVEYIDLSRNPGFERRYPQYRLHEELIILECGDRTSTTTLKSLFNTEYDGYTDTDYIVSSKAEQALTSAMMTVASDRQIEIVFLEGFNESSGEELENILTMNNYTPIRQNILTEEINASAWVTVICAPKRDYTEDELKKLDRYLQNGGAYGRSLIYFPSPNQPLTPNIDAFLAEWGIVVDDGLIFQTDNTKTLSMNGYVSAPEYTEYIYSENAINRRLLSVMPGARPLSVLFESKGNVNVTTPLVFSDTAVVAPLEVDEKWTTGNAERRGPIPAFAISSGSPYSQDKNAVSKVLVFGSYEFVTDPYLSSPIFGNSEYILSVFSILTGNIDLVYIAPKALGLEELPITSDKTILLGVVYIVILPVGMLLTGGVVFLRRKRS